MSTHADHHRRRLPVVGGLPGASYLNDRLTDAVNLLAALPEIVVTLRAIEKHIENVDTEVHLMRTGVDKLAGEVGDMRSEIQELSGGINEVSAAVGRLEPHVSDLSRLARPLRRRRRTDAAGETAHERRGEPMASDDEPPLGFA